MNDTKKQKSIEKKNKEIEDAVLMSQMMEHDGFKIFKKKISEMEKGFRFQDIMAIKEDALNDQKGIVMGINLIQEYFKEIIKTANRPRLDPVTGEPEKMNEKK